MANRFWVGNGGDWTDTAHWSATSGGSSGASVPLSSDDAFIDANSFSSTSQTINFNGGNCRNVSFVGATNTPALSDTLNIYGNATFISQLDFSNYPFLEFSGVGTMNLTSGGAAIQCGIDVLSGNLVLLDDLSMTNDSYVNLADGSIDFNDNDVNTGSIYLTGTSTDSTINFGSGTITIESNGSGKNVLTIDEGYGNTVNFNAETSTIVFTFAAGGGKSGRVNLSLSQQSNITFHNVTVLGTGSGNELIDFQANSATATSATFNDLILQGAPCKISFQTITSANDPFLYTASSFTANGTVTDQLELVGEWINVNTEQAELSCTTVSVSYLTVSNVLASGVAVPFDDTVGGIDGGNNTNWLFTSPDPNVTSQNVFFLGSDTDGDVLAINVGKSDNTTPIYFELETQELEMDNRAHLKKISNKIGVMTQEGIDTSFFGKANEGDYQPIKMSLDGRTNIGKDVNLEGNFFTFKWSGETSTASPVLEGIYIEDITDIGTTKS